MKTAHQLFLSRTAGQFKSMANRVAERTSEKTRPLHAGRPRAALHAARSTAPGS
jgi:hypothetical protein